jgi:hypothetical protein
MTCVDCVPVRGNARTPTAHRRYLLPATNRILQYGFAFCESLQARTSGGTKRYI